MIYPSIRIEGGILSPDVLDRVESLPGQKPAEFGLESSARVKDEIARAWADAQDYWRIFQRRLETLRPESPATTETRQQWIGPLLGLLGYELEFQARGAELNGKLYSISHRVANRGQAPVHVVGYRERAGLDRKPERARMSAHGVVQEYLNLDEHLYGLVTNGRVLRLLRDSSRLIKLTYLEFDLDRIFTDGLFADFAVMYRLLHVSRLPHSSAVATESWLERYHLDSLESGARIREGLSVAVERAIRDFGNGFLRHPENERLRELVARGAITPQQYYQHLLRLIYRLLFLMVIEERDLVFPASAPRKQREVYRLYYSIQRLRLLSEKRYLADHRRHDLWLGLLSTFRLFEADGPGEKLGVSPLGGDLFSYQAIGALAECTLGNDVLLGCLRALNLYQHPDNGQLIRVNYGGLNVEEFGSVYEGLLELKPDFVRDGDRWELVFVAGDERSRTGSHYTPDDLVQPLIKHSLDYLIADRLKAPDPAAALLDLRVADVACGSGHILLAAARRIATELAVVRSGEEQPSPSAFRAALRDVIRNCVYGVDLNPLAVELCKVALWLEAHVPGQPLNFLDHHVKRGNAIVGFVRPDELEKGVPDEAFKTMPGDDKALAAEWRKKNKRDRAEHKSGQLPLSPEYQRRVDAILAQWNALSALPERTPTEIEEKKRRFVEFAESRDAWLLKEIADIPIAQFYVPKTKENERKLLSDGDFRRYYQGGQTPQGLGTGTALAIAEQKRFFHWFLEFPDVIARGGFDCILGNPPYLGGQALSGTYGNAFCEFLRWEYEPTGLNDLVAFFVRRIFMLLREGGFTAFITTNSVKEGGAREDGLVQVLANGACINMAVRGIKWPGRANLYVSLVSLHKGLWRGRRFLDDSEVSNINSHFEDGEESTEPRKLSESSGIFFNGSNILGEGFYLGQGEGERILGDNPRCRDVIFRVMNGKDIVGVPQGAVRLIINFFDWPIEKANEYPTALAIVRERVQPERAKIPRNTSTNRHYHDDWWQYGVVGMRMYSRLQRIERCFAMAAPSKYLALCEFPTDIVFTHAVRVLTSERWDVFTIVQSSLHEQWARKYSGALETRLRYSPSDCFDTFPFPRGFWQEHDPVLWSKGEQYHAERRGVMLVTGVGLTDIYNLFHNPNLSPPVVAKVSKKSEAEAQRGYEGLLELRRLHRELDIAVRDAYGWQDLDLGHDFHEVETLPENDRVRYTISPAARKEVLRRLLALNHERAAEEAAAAEAAAAAAKPRRASRKREPVPAASGDLFDE